MGVAPHARGLLMMLLNLGGETISVSVQATPTRGDDQDEAEVSHASGSAVCHQHLGFPVRSLG